MTPLLIITLLAVAAASGLVGSFALMRRMTLAADSMSHIALPGLAVALMFSINPFIGALASLLVGALLIWGLEERTKIKTETIIGVVFSASLAIGALLIKTDHDLLEALFGNITGITNAELIFGLIGSAAIIAAMLWLKERIVLSTLSPEIAQTVGVNNRRLNLVFIIIFALAMLLGLKFLGVLLMGSLIIIPAATAKNLATSLWGDFILAISLAVIATAGGLLVSTYYTLALGPSVVTVAAGLFFISLFFIRR